MYKAPSNDSSLLTQIHQYYTIALIITLKSFNILSCLSFVSVFPVFDPIPK